MARTDRAPAPATDAAPSLAAFSPQDWMLLSATALTWGSSFVWMQVALEALAPGTITWLRVLLGVATLVLFPRARARVERRHLGAIVWLGLLWMAIPLLLFPIALQWIDSSLAGMINGAVPIFAGVVSAIVLRQAPPGKTIAGIAIGFLGLVAVSWPAIEEPRSTALGVVLVILATLCYGIAINIAVPLQRRYGSLPIILRAQIVALAITALPGILGLARSSVDVVSVAAMIPLGALGTGLAFVWMAMLVGRVGAARGSVTIYFVPVVAIVLGWSLRDENISWLSLIGSALVILGAFVTSRTQRAPVTSR